jgi:F-type H+-transporting ATPase subunit a
VSEVHGHEAAEFDAGTTIMHHIKDARAIELPFLGEVPLRTWEVHIPTWEVDLFGKKVDLFGWTFDISLSKHVIFMWVAAVIVVLLFGLLARRRPPADRAPGGLRGAMEAMILFVRDELARKNIGPGSDRWVPYLLTTFFFILCMNLLGLVPWGATATGNIGVTASLAGIAFVMIQWGGIREHGVLAHCKNLVPPGLPALLLPVMIPVEILGMFAKPFALCIRLFANMVGGHVIILSLFCLIFIMKTAWVATVSVPFALFIYLLEIFVAFLQAYIFTMLTSLFIGMTAHPQH